MVGRTISVQRKSNVLLVLVLAGKRNTSTNRNLSTNYAISAVKPRGEHVHGSTLSICDTLSPSEQFTNDRLHSGSAHQCKTVAPVGSDEMVRTFDGMLNADRNGLLSGGQMAETPNLLLLVEPIGRHLHSSIASSVPTKRYVASRSVVPHSYHVVVHLFKLFLGNVHRVRRRIELVCLESLIGKTDLEGLVILLPTVNYKVHQRLPINGMAETVLTSGTFSGSVCDEAASVVTNLKVGRAMGATKLRRKGVAMLRRMVLENIVGPERGGGIGGRWEKVAAVTKS